MSWVRYSKTWQTAYWHDRTLARGTGMWDANFYDVETGELFWLCGPKRDLSDGRYGKQQPTVDEDVREAYESFLDGAPAPGRVAG